MGLGRVPRPPPLPGSSCWGRGGWRGPGRPRRDMHCWSPWRRRDGPSIWASWQGGSHGAKCTPGCCTDTLWKRAIHQYSINHIYIHNLNKTWPGTSGGKHPELLLSLLSTVQSVFHITHLRLHFTLIAFSRRFYPKQVHLSEKRETTIYPYCRYSEDVHRKSTKHIQLLVTLQHLQKTIQ